MNVITPAGSCTADTQYLKACRRGALALSSVCFASLQSLFNRLTKSEFTVYCFCFSVSHRMVPSSTLPHLDSCPAEGARSAAEGGGAAATAGPQEMLATPSRQTQIQHCPASANALLCSQTRVSVSLSPAPWEPALATMCLCCSWHLATRALSRASGLPALSPASLAGAAGELLSISIRE